MSIDLPADGWRARSYQRPLFAALEGGCKRAFCLWHRRAGKGQAVLNFAAMSSQQTVGSIIHILPSLTQARSVIWEGLSDPPESRPFLAAFPGFDNPDQKMEDDTRLVFRRRDDQMKLWFKNGSTYQLGGADQPDVSYRGINAVLFIFDEYAKSPKMRTLWDRVARPILTANDGTAIFICTPDGKNHAYKLYESVKERDDWFVQVLTIDDTSKIVDGKRVPVISSAAVQAERETGMSEALVGQEYYCKWEGPSEGSFFGDQMRQADKDGRIGVVPWDEKYPVITAWDLGIADFTVCWFIQEVKGWYHWIDYLYGRDLPFDAYLSQLRQKPYAYSDMIGPHDMVQRDRSANSCYSIARNFGFNFRVAPKLLISDGISALRSIIPKSRFDAVNCAVGVEGLRQYRRTYDQSNDMYLENPVHDQNSHPADAARTFAIGRRQTNPFATTGKPLHQRVSIV